MSTANARRTPGWLAAALAAATLSAVPAAAKTLVYCSEGSPENFTPALNTTGTSFDAARPVYDKLTEFTRGSTTVEPGLAESWDVGDGGKTITFKLRKGVKFHGGVNGFTPTRDFNADDVLFSFERQWKADHPYAKVSGGKYDYFADMGLKDDVASIVSHIEAHSGQAFVSRGVMRTIIGVVGTEDVLETLDVGGLPGVAETMRITAPYKLVSAQNHAKRTTIRVGGVPIGPDTFTLIAGPCAVESAEQTLAAAQQARRAGATLLRGGAYKPRTSPYAFQGLGVDGLRILAEVSKETGLPVVTEIMDPADVDVVAEHADMFQIGTRNMQNFPLLQAVGAAGKPVMLKRGLTATYEEWLMAAEYIAQRGNLDIVLCERGIRGFEPTIRNMLDVSAIPMVHAHSHLPVIVDPSHAAGRRDLVLPLARAGMAAGADGVMVDVHPEPERALCDGAQALSGDLLDELTVAVATIPPLLGRRSAVTAERVHPSR